MTFGTSKTSESPKSQRRKRKSIELSMRKTIPRRTPASRKKKRGRPDSIGQKPRKLLKTKASPGATVGSLSQLTRKTRTNPQPRDSRDHLQRTRKSLEIDSSMQMMRLKPSS